jgi:hypothetical protein
MDRLTAPTRGQCVCGERVDAEAGRVLGDERGVVPACPACWVRRQGDQTHASVYQAVLAYRRGSGHRKGAADD